MIIWVLMTATYMGGYVNGYSAVTFQEFSTKERCEDAAAILTKWSKGSNALLAVCVPRS